MQTYPELEYSTTTGEVEEVVSMLYACSKDEIPGSNDSAESDFS